MEFFAKREGFNSTMNIRNIRNIRLGKPSTPLRKKSTDMDITGTTGTSCFGVSFGIDGICQRAFDFMIRQPM